MSNRFIDYDNPSHHYIYKITDTETGRYYIGKRTCPDEPELDVYWGSGNEILEYQKQYGRDLGPASNGRFVKEIVEHCGSEGEAYYREEIIIGDRWQNDPLCMNVNPGGLVPPKITGKSHHKYNPTKYHFYDHNTGKDFHATRYEMYQMGYNQAHVSALVLGKVKSMRGITLYDHKEIPFGGAMSGERNPSYDPTEYHFYDTNTKQDYFATRYEMKVKGYRPSTVSNLINEKIRSMKGVVLYKNRAYSLKNPLGKGVSFYKASKKYIAYSGSGSKRIYLGLFKTPEAANDAIQEYKAKLG